MLTTAVKAARKAGSIITRASSEIDRLTVRRKQHNDFVSEVDHAAEEAIIRTLREGIAHLTEALEALRSEPRLKLAESAAQAIGEAQKLLGTRRKFSISGGGL